MVIVKVLLAWIVVAVVVYVLFAYPLLAVAKWADEQMEESDGDE